MNTPTDDMITESRVHQSVVILQRPDYFFPHTVDNVLISLCSVYYYVVLFILPGAIHFFERLTKFDKDSFIHSDHFYSAPSTPLPLRGAPDYSTDTVLEFNAKAHRQLQVKDLPTVPTCT